MRTVRIAAHGVLCTARAAALVVFSLTPALFLAQTKTDEPKDAIGWLLRASEQMNLRTYGAAPFHLKATFHAFPGIQLLDMKKMESERKKSELKVDPEIITGDGVYEETWISTTEWRREVTFGSYHAVEAQSGRVRKMQASSDYEPSRVLMLLDGLLNPVARNVLNPDLGWEHFSWKVDRHEGEKVPYVRITNNRYGGPGIAFGYILLPNGVLVMRNERGLVTGWQDQVAFAGKIVPRHLSVQAMGKDLLTADAMVEPAGHVDPAFFDLAESPAEAGMTLRPLYKYDTNRLYFDWQPKTVIANNPSSSNVIREMVDRHGVVREAEIVYADGFGNLDDVLDFFRKMKVRPAEFDGSPCEVAWDWVHLHP